MLVASPFAFFLGPCMSLLLKAILALWCMKPVHYSLVRLFCVFVVNYRLFTFFSRNVKLNIERIVFLEINSIHCVLFSNVVIMSSLFVANFPRAYWLFEFCVPASELQL